MKRTTIVILGAGLSAALLASPVLAQKAAATAGSKEALAVVEKLVAAMGGRKVLGAIKDTTVSGTAEMVQYGITVPLTIYQKEPDKLRLDITIDEANMTIIQAFDGRKGWVTNPQTGATEEMPEFLARDLARQAGETQAFLDPGRAGVTYALKPKAAVEGRDYVVLEQTHRDGRRTVYFLDPETFLPYRTQTLSFDQTGAEVETETFTTDYRVVAGTTVPHALRTLHNGTEVQRVTIASVAYNTDLADAFFTLK